MSHALSWSRGQKRELVSARKELSHISLWQLRDSSFHHNMLCVTQRDPQVLWEQRGRQLAGGSRVFLSRVLGSYEEPQHRPKYPGLEARSYRAAAKFLSLETPRNLRLQDRVWGKTLTGGQLEIPPLPKKNSSLCTTMDVCLQRREGTE